MLIQLTKKYIRPLWREETSKVGLPPMSLHDLRKVSITYFYAMGIPLEIATSINCGWRDLNTARDYYLQYRGLLKREKKEHY
jgi:integrase